MKYENSKIYMLYSETDRNTIYIGSTTCTLNKRYSEHLSDYNRCKDVCITCGRKQSKYMSFKIFELGYPVKIELIEAYSCLTYNELVRRENHYIDHYRNQGFIVVNKRKA